MIVDGVGINNLAGVSELAIHEYIHKAESDAQAPIYQLTISPAGEDKVCLEWEKHNPKFERIRRITG